MTKKVLIVGEYYSENLGDGVICDNVNYLIKKAFPEVETRISDIMGRTQFNDLTNEIDYGDVIRKKQITPREKMKNYLLSKNGKGIGYFYERALYRKWKNERADGLSNIRNVLKEEFDLVVFAGGQLLYEPFVIPIEEHLKILREKNTPVIFNGCGIGVFNNQYILDRFQDDLNQDIIKSITVRDYVDEVNKNILPNNQLKAVKTSDSALWTQETYEISHDKQSEKIGLGIIHRSDAKFMEKQEELYSKLIYSLDERNIDWEIFCNGEVVDQKFAIEFLKKIGYPESKIAERKVRPNELVELIASYQAIISFRLHSHIISTSLGIPSIGMMWDKKVKFFFENYEASDRCFDVNDSHEKILEKLMSIDNKPLNREGVNKDKKDLQDLLINEISRILDVN